jgi:hypothetical protein
MFPKYKIKKWLFFKYKVKDGWEDLGKVGVMLYNNVTNETYYRIHSFCGKRINIGRESNGNLFMYCPRCMVKVTKKEL